MKVLQNITSNFIVAIDIETVRIEERFLNLTEGYQSAWEYKNKQDGEIPDQEVLVELWEKNSALYAEFSKVCAVSLTYMVNDNLVCKEFYGKDEKALLESLYITLNNMEVASSNYRLVGHAAKYFDYPFLCKRYIINGLKIPSILDTSLLKPWEHKNMCTNELWKGFGTGAGSSLQALCNVLNVPVSKVDLVGDEVGKAYYDDELSRIGRYCSYDTVATFNVIRRFKQEDIFSFEDVRYIEEYIDGKENTTVEERIPVLNRIYINCEISKEDEAELKELLGKKKIFKKDKTILVDMIHKLTVNSEMFKSDKPEVVAEKLKIVEELINNL